MVLDKQHTELDVDCNPIKCATRITTFFNSTIFLAVYFYTYILVIVTMIFMSIIRGKCIKLVHESCECLKNIKMSLTKIQITLNLAQAKRDFVFL